MPPNTIRLYGIFSGRCKPYAVSRPQTGSSANTAAPQFSCIEEQQIAITDYQPTAY